jgi:predicted Zn-dependent protease
MIQRTLLLLLLALALSTCKALQNINFFGIQGDLKLGLQARQEIANNRAEYPILDSNKYACAYQHIRRVTQYILASGKVKHRHEFDWKVHIIHDDKTLNAFVLPGGAIYVYTGIIKYLDTEDELAGVLGHEIAHADNRHQTKNLTKIYGVAILSEIVLGQKPSELSNILGNLTGKAVTSKFSRISEAEADAKSVEYLASGGHYSCMGVAGFFKKLSNEKAAQPPQWLSSHPSHENRVNEITAKAQELMCKTEYSADQKQYKALKSCLPK